MKHSTGIESPPLPPPPLSVCINIDPEGKSCLISVRILVLDDPPARECQVADWKEHKQICKK